MSQTSLLYKAIQSKHFSGCWLAPKAKDSALERILCSNWEEYFGATRGGVTSTKIESGEYETNEHNEKTLGADSGAIEQISNENILFQAVDADSALFSGELAELGKRLHRVTVAIERIAGVSVDNINDGVSPEVKLTTAQIATIVEQVEAFRTSTSTPTSPAPLSPVSKPKK